MLNKIIILVISLIIIIITWQLCEDRISSLRQKNGETALDAFIPTPVTIYKTYINSGNIILEETWHTLEKAALGFFIGTTLAIIIAVIFLILPITRNIVFPLSFALNSFPIVGLAPVIILFFGQGSWQSIVFISALICYFPTLISMDTAFKETDPGLLELMHVLKASFWQTFFKVRLPLALPYLFLSMKLAIPASIIGATMGEWLGAREGIGQLITIALYQLKPGLLYASLITITLVSIFFIVILNIIQFYIFPWKEKQPNL